jgi:hypothetical protein
MTDWADNKAERIVDDFVANDSSEDLLQLQEAIAVAIRDAYERGKNVIPSGLAFTCLVLVNTFLSS